MDTKTFHSWTRRSRTLRLFVLAVPAIGSFWLTYKKTITKYWWLPGILSMLRLSETYAASIGFEVKPRPQALNPGEGSYLLFEAKFSPGVITSFSAHFRKQAKGFSFQIWRPINLFQDPPVFTLVAQRSAPASAISTTQVPLSDPIRVNDGDRLGFVYSGTDDLPLSVTYVSETINMYRQTSDLNPEVGQPVEFYPVQIPIILSIMAEYDPDDPTVPVRVIAGLQGATGATGATGGTGSTGPTGHTGPKGRPGVPGDKGDRGLEGIRGIPGSPGERGDTGYTGRIGPQGEMGATGPPGEKGAKGVIGALGPAGPLGKTGAPGATGATGRQGFKGMRGPPGPLGPRGDTGATGGTGATGYTGHTGGTGPQGDPGQTGPIGLPGLTGVPGPKGDRGPYYQDDDECGTDAHGCQHKCVNTFGSYQCQCHEGYELESDGRSCKDVDECLINNGGCQVLCTNTIGSYTCSCTSGTRLTANGHHCADMDECQSGHGGCRQDELCVNTYGRHYCVLNAPLAYIDKGGSKVKINDVALPSGAGDLKLAPIVDDSGLVSPEVMIGIIVWLILLSLIILIALLCLCVGKMKGNRNGDYSKELQRRQKYQDNARCSKDFRFY